MATRGYRDLKVWQRAMELMAECYRLASRLPKFETYGMAGQLRRASLSVPLNIAEGNGRLHVGEYIHHVSIARGSVMEVDTILEAALRLGYLTAEDIASAVEMVDHVGRMLTKLARSLEEHR